METTMQGLGFRVLGVGLWGLGTQGIKGCGV